MGGQLACGVGTDQLAAGDNITLAQVEAAYREQLEVVEGGGGRAILMASRALCHVARNADDYLSLYGRLLRDVSRPVVLHWLGEMSILPYAATGVPKIRRAHLIRWQC